MVKIRLKRQGNKHRPFYRVVVTKSEGGRDSRAIENLGTYDPIAKPSVIVIDEAKALHWLSVGAQPSETVAYLLKKTGILGKYFETNPKAKERFKFLNKAIGTMSKESAVSMGEAKTAVAEKPAAVVAEPAPAPVEEPVAVAAPVEVPTPAPVEEPVAVAEPVVEETPAETTPEASAE